MAIYRKGRPKGYVRTGLNDGFLEKEWEKLPDKAKRKLLKLMVRISEKSYRRGVQQGVYLAEHLGLQDRKDGLYWYRYGPSLDVAPEANWLPTIAWRNSAEKRFLIEYETALRDLGIWMPCKVDKSVLSEKAEEGEG